MNGKEELYVESLEYQVDELEKERDQLKARHARAIDEINVALRQLPRDERQTELCLHGALNILCSCDGADLRSLRAKVLREFLEKHENQGKFGLGVSGLNDREIGWESGFGQCVYLLREEADRIERGES